jgi:hypothetical protein
MTRWSMTRWTQGRVIERAGEALGDFLRNDCLVEGGDRSKQSHPSPKANFHSPGTTSYQVPNSRSYHIANSGCQTACCGPPKCAVQERPNAKGVERWRSREEGEKYLRSPGLFTEKSRGVQRSRVI